VDEFIINSKIFCGSTLQINATDGYACGGVLQAGNLIRLSNVGLPVDKKRNNKSSNEKELISLQQVKALSALEMTAYPLNGLNIWIKWMAA
jgi:hypothetical protein